jgi:uncharacterized protein (TIGR02996 family)
VVSELHLRAAILSAPDEDWPRLVYADWLDDRGQPERAEFIRLQIEQARVWPDHCFTAADPCPCRHCELAARVREVVAGRQEGWLGVCWKYVSRFNFYRGFVETAAFQAAIFLTDGYRLVADHPVERIVLPHLRPARLGSGYGWCRGTGFWGGVPGQLFDLLPGVGAGNEWIVSGSVEEAETLLSAAAVNYARATCVATGVSPDHWGVGPTLDVLARDG